MSISESLQSRFNFYGLRSEAMRFEILDGNLWLVQPPGTKHQAVSLRMASALLRQVDAGNLGHVFQAPFSVVLSRDNVVQPDLLFIRKERSGMVGELSLQGAPDLVIEVLSQATRVRDIRLKKKIYADFEIPEYWIVDPAHETVEVLIWSEMGYVSAGVCRNPDYLNSPLMPLGLSLSAVFRT
jgi:Uma2 family endonuclease